MSRTRWIEPEKTLLMLLVIQSSIIHTATAHEKVRHRYERVKRQATTPPPPWDPNLILGAVNELRDVNVANNADILPWITSRAPTDSSTVSVSTQFNDSSKTKFLLSMLPSNLANRVKASPMSQMTTEAPSTMIKTKTPVVLEFDPLVKIFGGKGNTFSSDTEGVKEVTSDIVTNNPHGNRHESIILRENELDSLNMGFTVDVTSPDWLTDDSAILGVFDLGMDMDTPIIDFTSTIDFSGTEDVTSAVDTVQIDDVTHATDVTNTVRNDVHQHVQDADAKSTTNTSTLKPVIPATCNQQCLVKQRANTIKKIQQLDLKVKNFVCLKNGQKRGCWKNQTVSNHGNTNKKSSQTRVNEKKQNIFDTRIKMLEKQMRSLQTRLHVINSKNDELKNKKANPLRTAGKKRPSKVALNRNPKTPKRMTK
ncbi:hypothetical protein CHS0354_024862 [Potamilus streckersoni]|uniref:Uncharacterized protein n=1 Tax=Potamilus streckersoni TaxID=2493646 RepID=A0AAE0SQN4_9BIVA|nr:hypothetical protein CHS0354_024862 [Potamilus streckersoni]